MKYAIFMGCKIPFHQKQYGMATRVVLKKLGIKLVELDFNCCGYPNREIDFEAFILSSARNMALAEKKGLNILTPCKCCFGSFKHAEDWLTKDDKLRNFINEELAKEGLSWNNKIQVKHLLTVLHDDIGIETIKSMVINPQKDHKVAVHYGCHALRPGKVTEFDNPIAPTIFENLVNATGATSINWARRLDCCGNPQMGKNSELSLNIMKNKIEDASESGAESFCTACTYCQIQFDTVQKEELVEKNGSDAMPSILYPQLLGLSFGVSKKKLGIDLNEIPFK